MTVNFRNLFHYCTITVASFPGIPCFLFFGDTMHKRGVAAKMGRPWNTHHMNDARLTWGVGVHDQLMHQTSSSSAPLLGSTSNIHEMESTQLDHKKKLPLKFSAHVFVVVPYPPMSISHPPHVIKQWRRSGMKLPDCMCCKHSSGMHKQSFR